MRQRRNDVVVALALALLLHVAPPGILWWASWSSVSGATASGDPVQADTIDINALSASTRSALQREPIPAVNPVPPPPQPEQAPTETPLPEALPEDVAEPQPEAQDLLARPDQEDREEARADSDSPQTASQEQDAKHRQGQVDLTRDDRQQRMQENEMERQRRQEIEDLRRQREAARREAALAEDRLQQLADARARAASNQAAAQSAASAPPGNGGQSRNLQGAYAMAVQLAIRSNWTRPDNVPMSAVCKIVIRQIPNGAGGAQVVSAQVDPSCPYDELGRRSVEAAVLKAQPLPYQGFEAVFARALTLNFRAEDP